MKVPATTPHLMEHSIQAGYSKTGIRTLELWLQWDNMDGPVRAWKGHMTDFLSLGRAAYRMWLLLKRDELRAEIRRAWHILMVRAVVQHLRESRIVKIARSLRRRIDATYTRLRLWRQ